MMDVFTRRRIARGLQIFPPLSFLAAFSFERGLVPGEPEMSLFGRSLKFRPSSPLYPRRRRVAAVGLSELNTSVIR